MRTEPGSVILNAPLTNAELPKLRQAKRGACPIETTRTEGGLLRTFLSDKRRDP